MRQVTITKTQVLKRTASITISVPNNLEHEDISDWLLSNNFEIGWEYELDVKLDAVNPEHDSEFDVLRYDVYETQQVCIYGGHL